MCFVVYIPNQDGFLLGSNRDEHAGRKPALPPREISLPGGSMLMPVDGKAGGTWMALRNDGVAMVLLNGAFINHERKPVYRQSRGLIIPQLMQAHDPLVAMHALDLEGMEPFTVMAHHDQLKVWRWDGNSLHEEWPDPSAALCISSATLYNRGQQQMRADWFTGFLKEEKALHAHGLLQWLSTGGHGPDDTDIVLKRQDGIRTVSSTVLSVTKIERQMLYRDYLSGQTAEASFSKQSE